jgi:hypothetical protein
MWCTEVEFGAGPVGLGSLLLSDVSFSCSPRRGKGASGQAYALRWSGLRFASAALRCSVSWPRRSTPCVRCALSAQTDATSQMTKRAARAATSPALLGAPQARSSLPERTFAEPVSAFVPKSTSSVARQAVPGGGDLCGDEEHRFEVGARSAHQHLTRRVCLTGESAANAGSSAARPRTEHRSAVGAKRRPPQHEPPSGTACRDARMTGRRGLAFARVTATTRRPRSLGLPRRVTCRGSCDAGWRN